MSEKSLSQKFSNGEQVKTLVNRVSGGAEDIRLSEKAKAAIDVLFAAPKSVAQYVEGKAAEFLAEKTPVAVLARCLRIGLSSGLPSDIKQIDHGRIETPSLREILKSNVKDSTRKVFSKSQREL